MLRIDREILISAPTVAEIGRSSNFPPLPIPSVRNVTVVAFDRKAAIVLAEKFPEQVIRAHAGTLPINYMRYDALILACAVRYNATLVTLDNPLSAIANAGGAKCMKVEEFQTQLGLLFGLTEKSPAAEPAPAPAEALQSESVE
jgi:predicted nucleic acid-binding protein